MVIWWQIRKRDWSEHGALLKARINTKLLVYKAAATLMLKSLACFDFDAKLAKKLAHETLALFMDAVEACLLSVWRKLRICEELFRSLLAGLSQIAVTRGGQSLRILLIRLKPVVLTVCAQVNSLDQFRFILHAKSCSNVGENNIHLTFFLRTMYWHRLMLGPLAREQCLRVS